MTDVHPYPKAPGRPYREPARPSATPQRTRAILAARRLSLSDVERREVAAHVVGHSGSWSTLSEDDGRRLADAFETFHVIQAQLLLRGRRR